MFTVACARQRSSSVGLLLFYRIRKAVMALEVVNAVR